MSGRRQDFNDQLVEMTGELRARGFDWTMRPLSGDDEPAGFFCNIHHGRQVSPYDPEWRCYLAYGATPRDALERSFAMYAKAQQRH